MRGSRQRHRLARWVAGLGKLTGARSLLRVLPLGVVVVVIAATLWSLPHVGTAERRGFLQRLEWMTFDWRARWAARHVPWPTDKTNTLAAVLLHPNFCLQFMHREDGVFWPLPRDVHGEVAAKLLDAGAAMVGFDILFTDPHWLSWAARRTNAPMDLPDGDRRFAELLARHGNEIALAAPPSPVAKNRFVPPLAEFADRGPWVGHIAAIPDSDGIRRRIPPYQFPEDSRRYPHKAWHLGIVMAAKLLDLDLSQAREDRRHGVRWLTIPSRTIGGEGRTVPLDADGNLVVNWELSRTNFPSELHVTNGSIAYVASSYRPNPTLPFEFFYRIWKSPTNSPVGPPAFDDWAGRAVVICSTGSGGNIQDRGADPLSPNDLGGSATWNVANAIIQDRFVRESSNGVNALIVVTLGLLAGFFTWRLRALVVVGAMAALSLAYVGLAFWLYDRYRLWIPLVSPVGGALFLIGALMVGYRILGEILLRRRDLAPYVIEVLWPHRLRSFPTEPCQATVLFADIRGFTVWLADRCEEVERWCLEQGFEKNQARLLAAEGEQQLIGITNGYLTAVAECVKRHRGTLDKFIGDCVMAFWGAPVHFDGHAELAVRAAIEAQRAVEATNRRLAAQPPFLVVRPDQLRPALRIPLRSVVKVEFGISVNSGSVRVGAMGDPAFLSNYTVFGRVVNAANHLQQEASGGRIVAADAVLQELVRTGSSLAWRCRAAGEVRLDGRVAEIYDIDWREHPLAEETPS